MIIITLIYFLFIMGALTISFLIVYHLNKYSINPKLTSPMIIVFVVITTLLIIANIYLFIELPFDELISSQLYY